MLSRGKGSPPQGLFATTLLMQPRMWTTLFSARHTADYSSVCCWPSTFSSPLKSCFLSSQSPSCTVLWDYSTLAVWNGTCLIHSHEVPISPSFQACLNHGGSPALHRNDHEPQSSIYWISKSRFHFMSYSMSLIKLFNTFDARVSP